MKQIKFNLDKGKWGGRRKGAGRTRIHSKGVAHRTRERVTRHTPTLINMKYNTTIKTKEFLKVLKRAILNSRKKDSAFCTIQFRAITFISSSRRIIITF